MARSSAGASACSRPSWCSTACRRTFARLAPAGRFRRLGVLLLTVLFWPIGWLTRRRYRATFPLAGTALRAYVDALGIVGSACSSSSGWMAMIGALFADLETWRARSITLLWVLQIVGLIAFVGAVAIAGWNAWLTWRDGRRWSAKVWTTLIAVSALRAAVRRLHLQSPLDDGELLMARLSSTSRSRRCGWPSRSGFRAIVRNGRRRGRHPSMTARIAAAARRRASIICATTSRT